MGKLENPQLNFNGEVYVYADDKQALSLQHASAIAPHDTPKMVLRILIFSIAKSGELIHNYIQNAHLLHT